MLLLLLLAAAVSYFVGERSDALIIATIVGFRWASGFVNEYRAERAAQALHSQIRHQALVVRDGAPGRDRRDPAGVGRHRRAAAR
jgi:Mg2+-importing ATPase